MIIHITRADPLGGIPYGHEPVILSHEEFPSWDEAFASLRARGVPISSEHEEEMRDHSATQFAWREFINVGTAAYTGLVHYDVRAS